MSNHQKILITGGTGLIGRHLAAGLEAEGYAPYLMSRTSAVPVPYRNSYIWDPSTGIFDAESLSGTDAIIHLAGAGIADKPWSPKRKLEILNSRKESAHLLAEKLKSIPNQVKTIVAASATGFYGDSGPDLMTESSSSGTGFLAEATSQWENALKGLQLPGIRLVILRVGFVLDKNGGALPQMVSPVKLFAGASYGSGSQYISWIDMDDLAGIFLKALNDPVMNGVYNAVAPSPVTNREFIRQLGKSLHRPVWPFPIPAFVFRALLGEKADLVLGGQRVSSGKIEAAGYSFRYPQLQDSLHHQLKG